MRLEIFFDLMYSFAARGTKTFRENACPRLHPITLEFLEQIRQHLELQSIVKRSTKLSKFHKNYAKDTPPRGVFIPKFRESTVLGVQHPHPCTDWVKFGVKESNSTPC